MRESRTFTYAINVRVTRHSSKIFSKFENAMNGIKKNTKQLTVIPLVIRLPKEVYNAFHESIWGGGLLITETNERIQALKKDLNDLDNEKKLTTATTNCGRVAQRT